jgi:hypothetical protein
VVVCSATAAKLGLPVILVSGSRGRAKEAEATFVAMVRVPVAAHFRILCCLRRTWRESCGEKRWPWAQANVFFASSRLGLVGVIQGVKMIGTLLQMTPECSFVQRSHSLALAAPLKQRAGHKRRAATKCGAIAAALRVCSKDWDSAQAHVA